MDAISMNNLEAGKRAGEKAFSQIVGRGSKWHNRRIPIYIRKHLLTPWYIVPGTNGQQKLFIIRYPENQAGKVDFVEYQGGTNSK